jgi:hypothetical protein
MDAAERQIVKEAAQMAMAIPARFLAEFIVELVCKLPSPDRLVLTERLHRLAQALED